MNIRMLFALCAVSIALSLYTPAYGQAPPSETRSLVQKIHGAVDEKEERLNDCCGTGLHKSKFCVLMNILEDILEALCFLIYSPVDFLDKRTHFR